MRHCFGSIALHFIWHKDPLSVLGMHLWGTEAVWDLGTLVAMLRCFFWLRSHYLLICLYQTVVIFNVLPAVYLLKKSKTENLFVWFFSSMAYVACHCTFPNQQPHSYISLYLCVWEMVINWPSRHLIGWFVMLMIPGTLVSFPLMRTRPIGCPWLQMAQLQ